MAIIQNAKNKIISTVKSKIIPSVKNMNKAVNSVFINIPTDFVKAEDIAKSNYDKIMKGLDTGAAHLSGWVKISEVRKTDGHLLSYFEAGNVVLDQGRDVMVNLISGAGDPNSKIIAIQVGDGGALANGTKTSAKDTDASRVSLFSPLYFRIHNDKLAPADDSNTNSYVSTQNRLEYANEVKYNGSSDFVAVKYKILSSPQTEKLYNRTVLNYKFTIDPVDLNQGAIAPDGQSILPNAAAGFNEFGFIHGSLNTNMSPHRFNDLINGVLITHFTMATRPQDANAIYIIDYGFGVS